MCMVVDAGMPINGTISKQRKANTYVKNVQNIQEWTSISFKSNALTSVAKFEYKIWRMTNLKEKFNTFLTTFFKTNIQFFFKLVYFWYCTNSEEIPLLFSTYALSWWFDFIWLRTNVAPNGAFQLSWGKKTLDTLPSDIVITSGHQVRTINLP